MSILEVAQSQLPSRFGEFQIRVYREPDGQLEHVALIAGQPRAGCLARVHSECITGDVFGSLRCDCAEQLAESMRMIGCAGAGIVIYLRGHEGRGIGLAHKIAAYALQDQGWDTAQANHRLGLPTDARRYDAAVAILRAVGLDAVRLISNNPDKLRSLEAAGIRVVERIALWTQANAHNQRYLETKRTVMGHLADEATDATR